MKNILKIILSVAVAVLLVWLLFRDTPVREVVASIRTADGWLILLSAVPLLIALPLRVQRWACVVRAVMPVRFWPLFSAMQIGFMANFTLPLRMGEVIRIAALMRLTGIPLSKSAAFGGLDRLTDLVGVVTMVLVSLAAFPRGRDVVIPKETFGYAKDIVWPGAMLETATEGLLAMLLVLAVLLGVFCVWPQPISEFAGRILGVCARMAGRVSHGLGDLVRRVADRTVLALHSFSDGLGALKSFRHAFGAIVLSLLTWGGYVLHSLILFKAFHADVPWYGGFLMQALVAVGTGIPGAPGLIGQYHIPIVVAILMVSAMPVADAKALAMVSYGVEMFLVLSAGLICLFADRRRLFGRRVEEASADAETLQV